MLFIPCNIQPQYQCIHLWILQLTIQIKSAKVVDKTMLLLCVEHSQQNATQNLSPRAASVDFNDAVLVSSTIALLFKYL